MHFPTERTNERVTITATLIYNKTTTVCLDLKYECCQKIIHVLTACRKGQDSPRGRISKWTECHSRVAPFHTLMTCTEYLLSQRANTSETIFLLLCCIAFIRLKCYYFDKKCIECALTVSSIFSSNLETMFQHNFPLRNICAINDAKVPLFGVFINI